MCRIIRKIQCPRPMRQNSQNRSSNGRITKIDEKASKKRSKKTSRKTRPERAPKTAKMTPKRHSRAPWDPPGTPETSILGVPARGRNFDQKTEPQKIGFSRVLGYFRLLLGSQKPGILGSRAPFWGPGRHFGVPRGSGRPRGTIFGRFCMKFRTLFDTFG